MVPEPENTTGVTLPYERAAMNGEELPDGLEYPDQILYLELRSLYDHLKKGIISRQTAIFEKKKLLGEYQHNKYNYEIAEEWVAVLKRTELARAAYRKERTLENADRLLRAVEGKRQ